MSARWSTGCARAGRSVARRLLAEPARAAEMVSEIMQHYFASETQAELDRWLHGLATLHPHPLKEGESSR
jgi:hypothetical protein